LSSELWPGTPVFTAGQYISAAGQLNALADAAHLIFDRVTGPHTPFTGARVDSGRSIAYAVRHRLNTLTWLLELNGTCHLELDGAQVAGSARTGAGLTLAAADISGFALPAGQFYTLALVVTAGDVVLWHLAETDEIGYPALAAFTAGTTPTAAEWNALSTYLETLNAVTAYPQPPFTAGAGDVNPYGDGLRIWYGSMLHRTNTLAYDVAGRAPYNKCDGGGHWLTVAIKVRAIGAPGWTTVATHTATNRLDPERFTGTADLSGAGLTFGDLYLLAVDLASCPVWDVSGKKGQVHFLAEITDAAPTVGGWIAPQTFAYPDTLGALTTLTNDLTALRVQHGGVPYNLAAHPYPGDLTLPAGSAGAYEGIRRERWLHYLCASEDAEPRLVYTGADGEGVSVSLEAAPTWQAADLAAQAGLYPGMRYRLQGVTYALEDSYA